MKLSISLVATNEKELLRKCLYSLKKGGMSDGIRNEIIVIDNVSTDGMSEMLKNEFPNVKIIRNKIKKGFCENHNIAINECNGEYVLVMNADIIAKKGFMDEMIKTMDSNKKVGMVIGKLLLGDGSNDGNTIDTTGLIFKKNKRVFSRGYQETDAGQYDNQIELFGVDGAAVLCRREMLEDIKLFGEYFDESFYAFKEDQDLCWRAKMRGWKIVYNPKAVAYHLRGWGKARKRSDVPKWIRKHSFKNRYLLMIKNDYLINILVHLPYILWFELKALIYMLFVEPHLFLALFQVIKLLPLTLKKRKEIMKRAVVKPKEIREWFK